MQFEPNTTVHLCKTPLKSDQKNQIDFNNRQAQYSYFRSTVIKTFSKFTYQRKDGYIRVPINAEILWNNGVNYVMYDNANFSSRWLYAFILRIEYVNDQVSNVYLKTDVYQTWFLDCSVNSCFVARETVINDDLFKNTLPENVPVGALITATQKDILQNGLQAKTEADFDENYYCVVMCSDVVIEITDYEIGRDTFSGGSVNGCYMYASTLNDFQRLMNIINKSGRTSSIVCCIGIPKFFVDFHEVENPDPPDPPSENNYLGSPYASHFTISQIYNPPNHCGIDFYGASNLNIYSTCSGEVVYSDYHEGGETAGSYGNLVCIYNSTNSCYYLYGHLSERDVALGDVVTKGQKIGIQGNTGSSKGSHLHYQITGGSNMWDKTDTRNPASAEFGSKYQNVEGDY